jgi:hypothetical protein
MLAALSNSNDLITSFDANPGKDHDFDFLVNNIPIQVKTLNPQESAQKSNQKIEELHGKEPSTLEEIKSNIVNYLTGLGGLDLMEKAIDQGARIIYLNISYVYLGEICRKFLNDTDKEGHLLDAVRHSVGKAKQITCDFPVIVCVCNSGFDYKVNALCIDIDVVVEKDKLKLDLEKLQKFDTH